MTVRLPANAAQLRRLYSKGWRLYGWSLSRACKELSQNAWANSFFEVSQGTFGLSVRPGNARLDRKLYLWHRTKR